MTDLDDLDDALFLFGVHEGYPDKRAQMARKLKLQGWTHDDVMLLCRSIQKHSRDTGAACAAVLDDPDKARPRLADLRRGQQERAQAAEPPQADQGHDLHGGDPVRMRRIAYALVVADRMSAARACAVIGCDEPTLNRLIEEERQTRKG